MWVRQTLFVDHYYFYIWDREWGAGVDQTVPLRPLPVWRWCNGHEWVKQQLTKAGVEFTALDNDLWRVSDPAAAHRAGARLSDGNVRGFLDRWMGVVPTTKPRDGATR